MANRQLVHETKVADFILYLYQRYNARLIQPATGELFRAHIDGVDIGFAQRKDAQHLTSWGIGTKLAHEFISFCKRVKVN